jgi:hypothetical protein
MWVTGAVLLLPCASSASKVVEPPSNVGPRRDLRARQRSPHFDAWLGAGGPTQGFGAPWRFPFVNRDALGGCAGREPRGLLSASSPSASSGAGVKLGTGIFTSPKPRLCGRGPSLVLKRLHRGAMAHCAMPLAAIEPRPCRQRSQASLVGRSGAVDTSAATAVLTEIATPSS